VDYDAFGLMLADSNSGFAFPFGFAGGLADPDTGLVRFGARDYDPATGRWTARDPILFAGGLHLYAYAANDPVNRVDRDGLATEQGPSYAKKTLRSNTSTAPDATGTGVYGCRPLPLKIARRCIWECQSGPVADVAGVSGHRPPPLPDVALKEGGDHAQMQARIFGTVAQAVGETLPSTQTSTGEPGSTSGVEGARSGESIAFDFSKEFKVAGLEAAGLAG
jgi:RHS repeat-associated protein